MDVVGRVTPIRAVATRLSATILAGVIAISCRAVDTKGPTANQSAGGRTSADSALVVTAPDSQATPSPSTTVPRSGVEPRIVQNDTVALHAPPWNVTRVLDALRSADFVPAPSARPVHTQVLAVPGTAIGIRHGEVQLFIYGDANTAGAAATALARIPSNQFYRAVTGPVSRGMISSHLVGRPVVLSTDNLVAIVFSADSSVQHAVHDALTREHQNQQVP